MAKRITKEEKGLLGLIGNSEEGFLYMSPDQVDPLIKRGWAEQHPGMEEDGKFATRLTEEGIGKFKTLNKPKDSVLDQPEPEKRDGYVGEIEVEDEEVDSEQLPVVEDEPTQTPLAEEVVVAEVSGFELEKNIPVPPRTRKLRGPYKYPFDKMEVGDSFHIPATEDRPKPSRTLASTVSTASKKYGKTFVVRTVDDSDPKGVGARVFRLG